MQLRASLLTFLPFWCVWQFLWPKLLWFGQSWVCFGWVRDGSLEQESQRNPWGSGETVTSVLGMDGRFPCSSSDGKYHPITVIPAEAALYEPHQGQRWLSSPGLVMVILFPLLLSSVPQSSITPLRGTLMPDCTVTACFSPSHPPALVLLKEIVFSARYYHRGSL